MVTPGELDDAVALCDTLGLHLAVHAIGDGAVRLVLDSIERVSGGVIREPGNRHRIEHAEVIDEADVPRFARLGGGVVCSVQPCHLLTDIEVLTRQMPHRLHRVLPLRELIDAGSISGGDDRLLWFGSDVPIVRPDPSDSLQAALHRRRVGDPESAAIAPSQSITAEEAWAAFARASSAAPTIAASATVEGKP
jgi:predicted amidohydrolase YtcJ